jgi:hypothetical protein
MKSYRLAIQDIYEKNRYKEVTVRASNSQLAHKEGLKQTNALREEIALIKDNNDRVVFTFKDGFVDVNE